jgi:acetyl esterase/lipase
MKSRIILMRRLIFILLAGLTYAMHLRADALTHDITLQRDVIFRTVDGVDVKLDVAVPAGPGPYPLILCVHGGAWHVGDKSKFTPMIENMARHNYVAASINYRLAPKVKFPAPLEDTRAALQFLKKHAGDYKIDITRIGGTGESAGSHLAMLMAFEDARQDADRRDIPPLTDMRLQAIVNYYGPVDLSRWDVAPLVDFMWQKQFHESMESTMLKFIGGKDRNDEKVKNASPITYVNKDCPPVLTFHGTLDPVVPFHQAEILHAALRKAGVPETLVPIANGLHGGWAPEAKRDADEQALAFFDQYLKGKPAPEHHAAELHAAELHATDRHAAAELEHSRIR